MQSFTGATAFAVLASHLAATGQASEATENSTFHDNSVMRLRPAHQQYMTIPEKVPAHLKEQPLEANKYPQTQAKTPQKTSPYPLQTKTRSFGKPQNPDPKPQSGDPKRFQAPQTTSKSLKPASASVPAKAQQPQKAAFQTPNFKKWAAKGTAPPTSHQKDSQKSDPQNPQTLSLAQDPQQKPRVSKKGAYKETTKEAEHAKIIQKSKLVGAIPIKHAESSGQIQPTGFHFTGALFEESQPKKPLTPQSVPKQAPPLNPKQAALTPKTTTAPPKHHDPASQTRSQPSKSDYQQPLKKAEKAAQSQPEAQKEKTISQSEELWTSPDRFIQAEQRQTYRYEEPRLTYVREEDLVDSQSLSSESSYSEDSQSDISLQSEESVEYRPDPIYEDLVRDERLIEHGYEELYHMFEHERPYKHTYQTPQLTEAPRMRHEETPYYFQEMDVLGKKAKKEITAPKAPSPEKQTPQPPKAAEKPKEVVQASKKQEQPEVYPSVEHPKMEVSSDWEYYLPATARQPELVFGKERPTFHGHPMLVHRRRVGEDTSFSDRYEQRPPLVYEEDYHTYGHPKEYGVPKREQESHSAHYDLKQESTDRSRYHHFTPYFAEEPLLEYSQAHQELQDVQTAEKMKKYAEMDLKDVHRYSEEYHVPTGYQPIGEEIYSDSDQEDSPLSFSSVSSESSQNESSESESEDDVFQPAIRPASKKVIKPRKDYVHESDDEEFPLYAPQTSSSKHKTLSQFKHDLLMDLTLDPEPEEEENKEVTDLHFAEDHLAEHHQIDASQVLLTPEEVQVLPDFTKFLTTFGKSYDSVAEFNKRVKQYSQADQFIKEFNSNDQNSSFTVGHNEMSDWTAQEYKALMGWGAQSASNSEFEFIREGDLLDKPFVFDSNQIQATPAYVNWVEAGAVNPPSHQQQCGSCWTFSTTGAIEGANFIREGILYDLSEQQLVDCETRNFGCQGGWMYIAFQYLQNNAAMLDRDYPYQANPSGSCRHNPSQTTGIKVENYTTGKTNDPQQLKVAVSHQPVSVALSAYNDAFKYYQGGILDSPYCYDKLDHAVLIVGYGSENGREYWLVKNSWGSTWGEQGYVRIAIADGGGICGVQMSPVWPILADTCQ